MAISSQAGSSRPRATQVREPGLWWSQPGLERYAAPGGGAVATWLEAGDRVTVSDPEGRQSGELVLFAADGRSDPGALGAGAGDVAGRPVPAAGLQAILARGGETAAALFAGFAKRGIDAARAKALPLFASDGPAGQEARFTAERPAFCILAAPGGDMAADAQDPPTALRLTIARAAGGTPPVQRLPDPLAEPRLDFRIDRATAAGYEVRPGEFIQVIDVAGRQCSDFLAFHRADLDRGIERDIDATATRYYMGGAYPGPGLYSKFLDATARPLLELVRDTVGRHDTFGLACTAKYYEDMGYPGHVNCSDNINRAMASYGIRPRKGWPAINFFYNTTICPETSALSFDEPWSRPGDYVLLRATTDLICATTACPDDIDPANGWNPTDIHVRVYPATNSFSKAVAYRMTADAEPQLTRETGFHPRTSQMTRNFAEYRGYWLAKHYNDRGAVEEYWACRERVAMIDLSALRKFEVLGPDAETLMNYTLTRNVRRLSFGQVVYSAMCYDTGGMIDDGTLFRLGPDNFRWIGGDDYGGLWLREQAEKLDLKVWVKTSTDQLHNVAVQGPMSREVLTQVIWTPPAQPSLAELGWFRFAVGRLGDFDGVPLVVSRTGYSGELGYEIWCHPKDAVAVWDAVWRAGEPHGIAPLGLEALDMLRIEAGLIFAGSEFSDQTDPFEAGIGFTVALKTKNEDFVGREALIRRKETPQRVLVGLELDGNEPAAHGDCVHIGRSQVGVITSATRSPVLNKNIALCRIDVTCGAPGTEVEVGKIDGHQKRLPARVVAVPFYDPDKKRVRA
jgi:glycine cleavage system T protein (aminomethyltransferase)